MQQLNSTDAEAYEASIEQMASFYGVDAVEREDVVRWVLLEEQDSTRNACMTDLGYTVSDTGGIDAVAEQHDSVQRDFFRCFSMYPPHPSYTRQWDRDQVEAQFEWTVEALIPCLEGHGYSITEVPSRATFVQNWFSDPFYPMSQVPLDAIQPLEAVCLQQAPSAVLWEGVPAGDWVPGMSEAIIDE